MKKIIVFGLALLGLLILSGCAASDREALDELAESVASLQAGVDELAEAADAYAASKARLLSSAEEKAASPEPETPASGEPTSASDEISAPDESAASDEDSASDESAASDEVSASDEPTAAPTAAPAPGSSPSAAAPKPTEDDTERAPVAPSRNVYTAQNSSSPGTVSTAPASPAEESPEDDREEQEPEGDSDLAFVQEKGVLTVGAAAFKPMVYRDEQNQWIGYDADLAKAFADRLGVDVEFVEMPRSGQEKELNDRTIDCVWGGMILTDTVRSAMTCSDTYHDCAQVVIVPAEVAEDYSTLESLEGLYFAVEADSAGQEALKELDCEVLPVATQLEAIREVSAGTSDAAVVDEHMAAAAVGEGNDFDDLTYTVVLKHGSYAVGFRQGSDLADALNAFLAEARADGTLAQLAKTYELDAAHAADEDENDADSDEETEAAEEDPDAGEWEEAEEGP